MGKVATLSLGGGGKQFRANLKILKSVGFDSDFVYNELWRAVEPTMVAAAKRNVAPFSKTVEASVDVLRRVPRTYTPNKTVLVYVDKRKTMREWVAGQHPTSPRVKGVPGQLVAESLATMLELGTSKTWEHGAGIAEHRWFKSAVDASKGEVISKVRAIIPILIEMASKQFQKGNA